MYRRGKGFTLAELLTVLVIMLVLAGLLFPVFVSVQSAAKKSRCISNFHNAHLATLLYTSDYDDYFMPVNHRPAAPPNSRFDRTWVQLALPYARSFAIFSCPSDTSLRQSPDTTFDQDLVPGDIYSQYYSASMHVNMGYNYLYLSPVVFRNGRWTSEPRPVTMVSDPSRTLLFVDSIWNRTTDGLPIGGGNWLVVPPCRFAEVAGMRVDTFAANGFVFSPYAGWKVSNPNSGHVYGNAWPWHAGRINLVHVDGSVSSVSPGNLTAGCVAEDGWRGVISDPEAYLWDLR